MRAQLAAQLSTRQDAALAVAASWERVGKARDRLVAAEQSAASAVATAAASVPVSELAVLTGIPVAELRRLSRQAAPNGADTNDPSPAASPGSSAPAVEPATSG